MKPQAPRLAAQTHGAARPVAATGLGLDSIAVRRRMVQRLRDAGIANSAVLDALAATPRHLFVDPALAAQAYEDTSLPIGHGQTISKPSVVARMLELLFEGEAAKASGSLGRVLEIGTGCGYQAALLALVARSVISVERVRALYDKARDRLSEVRGDRIRLVFGDGTHGHAPNAPYDSIIASASGDAIPDAWIEQLAPGGRIVAPSANAVDGACQALVALDRSASGTRRQVHEGVCFVPLKFGVAQ